MNGFCMTRDFKKSVVSTRQIGPLVASGLRIAWEDGRSEPMRVQLNACACGDRWLEEKSGKQSMGGMGRPPGTDRVHRIGQVGPRRSGRAGRIAWIELAERLRRGEIRTASPGGAWQRMSVSCGTGKTSADAAPRRRCAGTAGTHRVPRCSARRLRESNPCAPANRPADAAPAASPR